MKYVRNIPFKEFVDSHHRAVDEDLAELRRSNEDESVPYEEWIVPPTFASKSCNSPFIGEKLPGVVHYTIKDGEIVYRR